jgi:sortase A
VIRRGLALALVALAAGFLAAGGRIYLKAQLAQVLLRRAWAETQATGRPVKPWSWADTWPVARLSVPRHDVDLIVLAGASGRTGAPPPAPRGTRW